MDHCLGRVIWGSGCRFLLVGHLEKRLGGLIELNGTVVGLA